MRVPPRFLSARRRSLRLIVALSVAIAGLATTPGSVPAAGAAGPFTDVPDGAFYTDAVEWMADTGITTGTSPTTFSPDDVVTRAQMAAFIARYLQTEGEAGAHGFADVPAGSYYDAAVSVLTDRAITTGTSPTTYSPDDVVTRAQMAAFLWRLAGEPEPTIADGFTDNPTGTFYHDAVRWLAEAGITTGTTATTYSPGNTVTRGQMATFLWRLADEPEVGQLGDNRFDADTTQVVEEGDVTFADLDPDGMSTMTWEGDDEPEVGDFVVMDVTEESPDAFLGKVVSVSGNTVVTEPAVLEEVVPEGNFDIALELDEDDPAALSLQSAFSDVFNNLEVECGAEAAFSVEAGFSVTPGLRLTGDWSFRDGVSASIRFYVDLSAEISAGASASVTCTATFPSKTIELKEIKFLVGSIPVWIEPEISFGGSVTANISGEAGISWRWDDRVGVTVGYADKKWSVDWDKLGDGTTDVDPTFAGQATLELELEARLDMLAYGRGGPYAALRPFFEVGAQSGNPWWWVDAGVRAGVGASFDTWFWKAEVEFAEIELARFRLADASSDPDPEDQSPPASFTTPDDLQTTAVDADGSFTCVITHGQVGCVGRNFSGQLGNGTTEDSTTLVLHEKPLGADGSPVDAVQIAVGGTTACALYDDGSVRCWGDNTWGKVVPALPGQPSPVLVDLPSPAREVYPPSGRQTCALLDDFSLACWGRRANDDYLADDYEFPGYSSDSNTPPYIVEGLGPVVDAGIRSTSACAVIADGTVWCWGDPFGDALGTGDGTLVPGELLPRLELEPIQVAGISGATEIDDTCVILDDQSIECWGDIWDDNPAFANLDAELAAVTDAIGLSANRDVVCVLHEGGGVSCMGQNLRGQAGDSDDVEVTSLLPVASLGHLEPDDDRRAAISVSTSGSHTCVQLETHLSSCWGWNARGQLGNNTETDSQVPVTFLQPPG